MENFEQIMNEKYSDILNKLRGAGFKGNMTMSVTDYGCSLYVMVNDIKIRISDHSVSNNYRMDNEVHFSFDKSEIFVEYVEKQIHPERFEKIYLGVFRNGIELFKTTRKYN